MVTVATAPTVYGIETVLSIVTIHDVIRCVATAPTVYGIETYNIVQLLARTPLQQHLPFTVLKRKRTRCKR